MKKLILLLFISCLVVTKLSAQAQAAQQLLLDVEKLGQLKQLLKDMKQGYTVLSNGYNTVKDLSQNNFSLHKTFIDGLMAVSPAIKKYKRVADIINYQLLIVRECKTAYHRFKSDKDFSLQELDYIGRLYNKLLKQGLNNLDDLTTIITAAKLSMTDDQRLDAIDHIYADMQNRFLFLKHFNNNTVILALQRTKSKNNAVSIEKIYGLTQ